MLLSVNQVSIVDKMPFSVLISVYAGDDAALLDVALKSIWEAQYLTPDEVVLVKDGKLSEVLDETIQDWSDKLGSRLVIVALPENQGLAQALNHGIKKCNHELVARMDADDISLPNRFSLQVEKMCGNPKLMVLGAWVEEFDDQMKKSQGIRKVPLTHDQIVRFAKRRNPFSHPSVIFRKSAIQEAGGYPDFRKAQDYALWSLLLKRNNHTENLEDILVHMRTGKGLIQRRGLSYLREEWKIMKYQRQIGFISGIDFCINITLRTILRLVPNSFKTLLYKLR